MRKTLALLASAALMGLTLAAHADTYSYNFTAGYKYGPDPNFSFTSTQIITSTTNLFTSPTISNLKCVSASASTAVCTALSINFGARDTVTYSEPGYDGILANGFDNSSFTVGIHDLAAGLLIVTDIAPPAPVAAATPEPSSLVLLGTGILGFAGAARRRFLNA